MTAQQSVVLVAAPGLLRNALQNLLSTFEGVGILAITSSPASTLDAIKLHAPALVILDADLLPEAPELADIIARVEASGGRLLLLATEPEQLQQPGVPSGYEVLMKGVRPEVLTGRIEAILATIPV